MDVDSGVGATDFGYMGFEDMLSDEDRNSKYSQALKQRIEEKKAAGRPAHVLDIGSGTGILSLLAARHGATSVTAIEMDPVVFEVSKKIAKKAGFEKIITFIFANAMQLDSIPRKANIFVSEVFDSELLGENVLRIYRHALKTMTTPDVVVIPHAADVLVVPIQSPTLRAHCDIPVFKRKRCLYSFPGIDGHWVDGKASDVLFLAAPKVMKRFQFTDHDAMEFTDSVQMDFKLDADRDHADGVLLWWDLDMLGDGTLKITSGPERTAQGNHWLSMAYGFPTTFWLAPETTLRIIGSHDECSFHFEIGAEVQTGEEKTLSIEYKAPEACTCRWHECISAESVCRWNQCSQEEVQYLSKLVRGKNIVIIGEDSRLLARLPPAASRTDVIQTSNRLSKIVKDYFVVEHRPPIRLGFHSDLKGARSEHAVDLIVFDLFAENVRSPCKFGKDYSDAQRAFPKAELFPMDLNLNMVPLKFGLLWRRSLRLEGGVRTSTTPPSTSSTTEASEMNDDDLEAMPLDAAEFGFGVEHAIPEGTNAFVFYLHTTDPHAQNTMLMKGDQCHWMTGTRAWVYFADFSFTVNVA
ncbi:Protein arginine N-methyltransferase [Aphelenchoides fujianensis]|nr:Protein arginine N-methyltransferase [Aphelenchoides fujianensis]